MGKNVCQVAQNVCLKMYVKTRPGTGTHRMCMSPGMYICYILYKNYILSKEVGKQYFRVTNDFDLMQLTMMKGGRSQNNTLSNKTQHKNKKL